jgi:hypothetical protein
MLGNADSLSHVVPSISSAMEELAARDALLRAFNAIMSNLGEDGKAHEGLLVLEILKMISPLLVRVVLRAVEP